MYAIHVFAIINRNSKKEKLVLLITGSVEGEKTLNSNLIGGIITYELVSLLLLVYQYFRLNNTIISTVIHMRFEETT